jgi:hypothetical protein
MTDGAFVSDSDWNLFPGQPGMWFL